ncbi:hypothetical protein TNCV_3159671 [Trichonephila clavipes]|nr:hypothetical protein TNCV_3159671 [Trichonephila clavipes]
MPESSSSLHEEIIRHVSRINSQKPMTVVPLSRLRKPHFRRLPHRRRPDTGLKTECALMRRTGGGFPILFVTAKRRIALDGLKTDSENRGRWSHPS